MTSPTKDGAPGDSPILLLENDHQPDGGARGAVMARGTPTSASAEPPAAPLAPSSAADGDGMSFLVEIVKATLPRGQGKRGDSGNRGMHCTAHWVGPANPSGRPRRETLLHRTKTMKIASGAEAQDTASADGEDLLQLDDDAEGDTTELILTVDNDSLFLLKTTMKQLVNASVGSTTTNDTSPNGGLRVDCYETPLDMISSVYSTVLASNIADKEANATTRESSSFTSYRLIGSVFLDVPSMLACCDEQRFERDLIENMKQFHQSRADGGTFKRMSKRVDGGRLAMRLRAASPFDVAVLHSLAENKDGTIRSSVALQTALVRALADQHALEEGPASAAAQSICRNLQPAKLITEMDENVLTAQTSAKALSNLAPIAQENVRYLFSNEAEPRLLAKPGPDPARVAETTWFTEAGLHEECYRPSTRWIQAGPAGGDWGRVYLEILECQGLPNVDAGGAVGNKTDPFVSVVYGDVMVQTEVIDDCCSPMWLPWTSRAYVFKLGHPSNYDLGPMEHECIGRVAIDMGKLSPGTLYTLTYNLYESSNLTEKGDDTGTITVRLRIEIPDAKKYLLEGRQTPGPQWVNSQAWKTHRVAKFCVDGPHDPDVFEMSLFRSHINELLTQKRYLSYAVSDAVRSLIFWRGQVKVGSVWLPLHSAVVFYFSIHVIEHPQLLPSFFLFGCGWIMIANMLQRASQPNPWKRGHSFADHFNVLVHGKSFQALGQVIHPNQGHKQEKRLESKWKKRLEDDDAEYAKQAELTAKIKSVSDDAIIRTRAKSKTSSDLISTVAGAKLLPYQQMLSRYCNKVRYIRNVMNWNESIISFFFTLTLFGSGCIALFVPWHFILRWTMRLLVWGGLGPWMRLRDVFFDENSELQKAKAARKAMELFREQHKMAKTLREQAIKMKAFRVKLFGKFITRLPELNLTRHEDVPLPQSFAEPYNSKEEIKTVQFVPSQDLSGVMIPMTGQDAKERKLRKEEEKERLLKLYKERMDKNPPTSAIDNHTVEGFEVVKSKSDNRLVCVPSEASSVSSTVKGNGGEITHARSNSIREIAVSDRAIQSALEKDLQESKESEKPKRKWVFSAQVSFSLRQESARSKKSSTRSLCNDNSKELIESDVAQDKTLTNTVPEQGVELVPFLGRGHSNDESDAPGQLEKSSDDVSVLYVKDGTNKELDDDSRVSVLYVEEMAKTVDTALKQPSSDNTMNSECEARDDRNITADAVKKIRFSEELHDIDRDDCNITSDAAKRISFSEALHDID